MQTEFIMSRAAAALPAPANESNVCNRKRFAKRMCSIINY